MDMPVKIFSGGDASALSLKKGSYKIYLKPKVALVNVIAGWMTTEISKIKLPATLNIAGKTVILKKVDVNETGTVLHIDVITNPIPIFMILGATAISLIATWFILDKIEKIIKVPTVAICGAVVGYYYLIKKN